MPSKNVKRISFIYSVVLSILLIITGVLLILSCISIYRIGDRPFTVENISSAFSRIQIPVYITIGAIIVGILLKIILPKESTKAKAIIEKKDTLLRLEKKMDTKKCNNSTLTLCSKEKKLRLIARYITAVLCIVSFIPAIIYTFNLDHYTSDYNLSVFAACTWILPCTFIAFGLCLALTLVENASYDRQIEAVKLELETASIAIQTNETPSKKNNSSVKLAVRLVILSVAILFVVLGILNGGMGDVLSKAINICTECIGLG